MITVKYVDGKCGVSLRPTKGILPLEGGGQQVGVTAFHPPLASFDRLRTGLPSREGDWCRAALAGPPMSRTSFDWAQDRLRYASLLLSVATQDAFFGAGFWRGAACVLLPAMVWA